MLLRDDHLRILFVDDGSTDGTGQTLAAVQRATPSESACTPCRRTRARPRRSGRGCSQPWNRQSHMWVTSMPTSQLQQASTGGSWKRWRARHSSASCLGRARRCSASISIGTLCAITVAAWFATIAGRILGIAVYDTQCGAKVFRSSPRLREALVEPFTSGWAFDVELLSRLTCDGNHSPRLQLSELGEVPLHQWRDVAGSKVSLLDAVLMAIPLGIVWRTRRKALSRSSTTPDSAQRVTEGSAATLVAVGGLVDRLDHPRTSPSSVNRAADGSSSVTWGRRPAIRYRRHFPPTPGHQGDVEIDPSQREKT